MIRDRLQELKVLVVEVDDTTELYRMDIQLTELMGKLHISHRTAESNLEQSEIKGDLALANSLLSILRDRISDAKNTNNRLNHNFRMHAKNMLDKSTFKEIMNAAIAGHSKKDK